MKDDAAFEAWIRGGELPCVAAGSGDCGGRLEVMHIHHRGIGGKKVPSIGNGIPGCTNHHTARGDSFHRAGIFTFEATHGIRLSEIAAWYERRWGGDFLQLAETPPKGAV